MFDNGSVSTKNKDGSVTAVDYKGNQYSEDKDGNSTVRTTDGYIATEYADGRQSLTEPSGKTTTINTDGSFSESFGVGLTLDYNADGGLTGIGITGSDERIGIDENGNYKSGDIEGPDNSKLTITDDGMKFVNADGTEYDHSDTGDKKTATIKWKNGTEEKAETTVEWNGDEKTENTDYTITDSNGNRWDSNTNITYDSDGDPKSSNNNVIQWTGADGSAFWMDNNSKAVQYSDKNGNRMIIDPNGNLTEYKDGKNSWNVTYDENGNVTSADVTCSDGAKMIQNPDGTAAFTLPDGTKYESDGNGNVFKNGVQIKKDGEWVEGYDPSGDTEKTDGTEPADTKPAEEPAADADGVSGLSASRVEGRYHLTGTYTWVSGGESRTEPDDLTITVSAIGDASLKFNTEDGSLSADYDPETGKAVLYSDGIPFYCTFSESNGAVQLTMTYEYTLENGAVSGSRSGCKQ